MTPDADMISREQADRQIQEAVAAALMEAAALAFYPSQKLRARHGSNIHVACFEANTKILALIPTDAMQALRDRDARAKAEGARMERDKIYRFMQHMDSEGKAYAEQILAAIRKGET